MRKKKKAEGKKQEKKGLLFVISGPSGSGKTTLANNALKARSLKSRLKKPVSLTTRPQRSGEESGRDYVFVSTREFQQARRMRNLLEWTRYLGYYYATPRDFVEEQLSSGRNLILCLDLKGALRLKQLYPENTRTIFIMPPSLQTLQERIARRCRKTTCAEIRQRIDLARKELLASGEYDYRLTNVDLKETQKKLNRIILKEIQAPAYKAR